MNYDLIKITFIAGLKNIVLDELSTYSNLQVIGSTKDALELTPIEDLGALLQLRSVLNIYVVKRGTELNPHYVSNHKSLLGTLIDVVVTGKHSIFKTYKLSCAGSQTKEVRETERYVRETYKLSSAEDADLEIYIGKSHGTWEVGVRITARPLSLREYKVENIPGGLNPTIAYAMNTLCDIDHKTSYLNICSGSATLLIEAAKSNPSLQLIGFDKNGKTNALAVQNIKKAGYLKSIQLKTADIFDMPSLETFDVITSDLPFGMQVSKGEDLQKLYKGFVDYVEKVLHSNGILAAYTAEYTTLETILAPSRLSIIETIDLTVPTAVGAYLHTKIFICKFK